MWNEVWTCYTTNKGSECAPAKRGRRENLTKDDIPAIVEAVLNAVEARGNTNPGGECPVARSGGHQVTGGSDNTGSHHTRETNSGITNDSRDDTANDTGDDTAGTTDRTLVSIIMCCPQLLNIVQAVPFREMKVFFAPSRIFRLTLFSNFSFAPRGFLPVWYSWLLTLI